MTVRFIGSDIHMRSLNPRLSVLINPSRLYYIIIARVQTRRVWPQVKPFIKNQSVKLKGAIDKKVVPAVLKATCKVLEVVANDTADAHDYLIRRAS